MRYQNELKSLPGCRFLTDSYERSQERSVEFIFIVSPFHRKIAGREALDLFSSSLPSIEKSPVEFFNFLHYPGHS
ncbi:hypothetical protein NQ317_011174 [Molorchus minor]|uniref:Maturase K n=1 Tax=Molorchus minor TaxID=1323400 RepID=A0ABQ9IZH3_9CUCU|nr:hypothetical protein NQ317_011174 [Molorchus minor]